MDLWVSGPLKISLIVLIIAAGIIGLVLMIGSINLAMQFKNEVKELFAQSKPIADKIFRYEQLNGLPECVQRYFKHVLREGQPYISYVSLTHGGQFKLGQAKDWMHIKGEQYFTTEKPGFIWKGTTALFTARDMYIGDKGRLVVLLLSLFKVVDSKGEKFNEGELQRWLAESVWFPTNLLPSDQLNWSAIDAHTAKLTFQYQDVSFFYVVTFNEIGEIAHMETQRFMSESNREAWHCKFTDYREMNRIIVPTTGEVSWKLAKGDFSYAKFKVEKMVYDRPEKF